MKIDLATVMTDLKGTPIKNGEADFVLSDVCVQALLTPEKEEESGEDKVKKYKLALRCSNGANPDLSVEDIALLKRLIGKVYSPLIVGKAFEVLDPES